MNMLMTTEVGKEMFYMANSLVLLLLTLVICVIMIAFFSLLIRWLRSSFNKDERYNLVEIGALRQVAEKIGIDMNYEKKLLEIQNGKTFRRRLEEKIMQDIFDKKEEKKK